VRARGYEEWKEPKVMGVYGGTGAEGTYVSAGGESVYTNLSEALSSIRAREWSCSRLKECYNIGMTVLRSDPKWCLTTVVRFVGVHVVPCK